MDNIENKSSLLSKINKIVEQKKDTIVEKLQNSHPWLVLLNWLLTNWISVILVSCISFLGMRYYLQLKNVEEQLLRQQIQNLNSDLEIAKVEKEKLLGRIKELDKIKISNKKETLKLGKEIQKLTPEKKKELLIVYKNRLLKKRGL